MLKHSESNRIEYKQSLADMFEEEVVSFLNYNEGGLIYVGVAKDGKVVGCHDADEIQLKIKDKLKHNISPSCMGLFEVVLEKYEDKDLELVEHLGSGLNRTVQVYTKDSFEIRQNYMRNIFYKNRKSLSDEGVKQLKNEDKIEFKGTPKNKELHC